MRPSTSLWDRFAKLTCHLEMSRQSVLEVPAGFFLGVSNGRTPWHVRRQCRQARTGRFDHYWISLDTHFNLAFSFGNPLGLQGPNPAFSASKRHGCFFNPRI